MRNISALFLFDDSAKFLVSFFKVPIQSFPRVFLVSYLTTASIRFEEQRANAQYSSSGSDTFFAVSRSCSILEDPYTEP